MTSARTDSATGRARRGVPRVADAVAGELRQQIIDGHLADGDLLPRQAALVEQFNVSLVSLREALRILETEGLISVRRGNRGGAVVHAPEKTSAAYMLGLLLQSESVGAADLAAAVRVFEPCCAVLAAQRSDRAKHLVPALQKHNLLMAEHLVDAERFTELGRQFHELLVNGCANQTVIAVVSTLEELWSRHERQWASRSEAARAYPSLSERESVLKTHTAITDAIELGDAERARHFAARHLADAQAYVLSAEAPQRITATSTSKPTRSTTHPRWRS